MSTPTLEQLNQPDVTVDMVRQYVVSTYPDAALSPELFITDADLGHLRWLQDWWQADRIKPEPTALPAPLLSHFLTGYAFGHTMDAQMQRFYLRCYEYCREHGLDTYNPTTKAPVKKRFANPAERMAHARAHRKVRTAEQEAADSEVAALKQQLAELQATHSVTYKGAVNRVKELYNEMTLAAQVRDTIKARQAAEVAALQEQIKIASTKQ